jgi:DnaJ-class molecular chaperone
MRALRLLFVQVNFLLLLTSLASSVIAVASSFPEKDCYTMLGILRNASQAQIKKAYRLKAKETHPDLHGNSEESKHRFQEIGEAYAILKDSEKRAAYDRLGSSFKDQLNGARQANAADDLYTLLGINTKASVSEITQAYNQKLTDLGIKGGEAGLVKAPRGSGYAAVADAYNILKDPELRELYDHRYRELGGPTSGSA